PDSAVAPLAAHENRDPRGRPVDLDAEDADGLTVLPRDVAVALRIRRNKLPPVRMLGVAAWKRRTGVIRRPSGLLGAGGGPRGPGWEIGGGEDAPLSRRGRIVFRLVLAGLLVLGCIGVALVRLG